MRPSDRHSPAIISRPGWHLPDRAATPEHVYLSRRRFLKGMGAAGLGALGVGGGLFESVCRAQTGADASPEEVWGWARGQDVRAGGLYPAQRSGLFALDRALTDERVAATHNNFYEFTTDKSRVWELAQGFTTRPWQVEVTGLVQRPQTFDLDELERAFPLEERLYRHRCVEAWAMAVPWTGFPLRQLLERAEPTAAATHVRFVSVLRPEEMEGQREQTWYTWPYYEGLRLDEAMNELTLLATGIYGHRLPPQHGAPVRIVTPWKYGYKSIKSIVRIELADRQPPTFWTDLQPDEYPFESNVNPDVPHPRWSQATEELIGTGERVPTQLFNGYGEWVSTLYS